MGPGEAALTRGHEPVLESDQAPGEFYLLRNADRHSFLGTHSTPAFSQQRFSFPGKLRKQGLFICLTGLGGQGKNLFTTRSHGKAENSGSESSRLAASGYFHHLWSIIESVDSH